MNIEYQREHDYCQMDRPKDRRRCSVRGCISSRGSLILHRFPHDLALARKWEEALKMSSRRNRWSFVCSNHFRKDDYVPSRKKTRILRRNVVPTQNLDLPLADEGYVVDDDFVLPKNHRGKVKLGIVPFVVDFLNVRTSENVSKSSNKIPFNKSHISATQGIKEETSIAPSVLSYSCSQCQIPYSTLEQLNNHIVKMHQKPNLVPIKEEKQSSDEEYEFEEEIEFRIEDLPKIKVEEISFS